MKENRTLGEYMEMGYFGEQPEDVKEMPSFWLRKVIAQERGERFFCQDFNEPDCADYPGKMRTDMN